MPKARIVTENAFDVRVVGAAEVCFQGVRVFLEGIPGVRSVTQIGVGSALVQAETATARDVFLLCACRLGGDTLRVLSQVRTANNTAPVLVWAADGVPGDTASLEVGATGYVQTCRAVDLVHAVAEVVKPTAASRIGDDLRRAAVPVRVRPLSPRQQQVWELVATGLTDKEIARRMGISYYTVREHLHSVVRKFGVGRRVELVALYNIAHDSSLQTATC